MAFREPRFGSEFRDRERLPPLFRLSRGDARFHRIGEAVDLLVGEFESHGFGWIDPTRRSGQDRVAMENSDLILEKLTAIEGRLGDIEDQLKELMVEDVSHIQEMLVEGFCGVASGHNPDGLRNLLDGIPLG